jgi:uncharacterized membrane protein YfcA
MNVCDDDKCGIPLAVERASSTMVSLLFLAAAAFLAGALNAIAGGGSFITFPALVFSGVPEVIANATNTVALCPGSLASVWAYRSRFGVSGGLNVRTLTAISLVGGAIGAILLLHTSNETFRVIVPWLLLFATILFAFGDRIRRHIQRVVTIGPKTVFVIQLMVAIYGGYFGGGIGILMLAMLAVFGLKNLHAMNAIKTLQTGLLNAVAVVIFIAENKVAWPQATVMIVTAIAGGYWGAKVAQRTDQNLLRKIVSVIGFVLTVCFFVRAP